MITLREEEVEFVPIRAQGAGGQNVNKVSNAIHLRFDVRASSLPDEVKARLLHLRDQRISADGVVVIKAQTHRSLERNRADALARLQLAATRRGCRIRLLNASDDLEELVHFMGLENVLPGR